MSQASKVMETLAIQLMEVEARKFGTPVQGVLTAVSVCQALKGPITRFGGPVGFYSLLSRALALAKMESPKLGILQITPEGIIGVASEFSEEPDSDVGIELIAHFLGLLLTFIGEPMMMTLLYDAWPDETFVSKS